MTKSEKLFEQFCRQNNIDFVRLLPDGNKTPDYKIILGELPIIIEIKELTLNNEEKQAVWDFEEKNFCIYGSLKIGNRIRYKIDDAKHQLKRLASGRFPAILVLYDARPVPIKGISPYEIKVAMYGWESIDLHVPEKLTEPVRFGKHRFGKGRKLRVDCHTYISAIGVLREIESNAQLHLDLYYNIFAEIPLPIEKLVNRRNITIFTLDQAKENEFRGWVRVVSNEK